MSTLSLGRMLPVQSPDKLNVDECWWARVWMWMNATTKHVITEGNQPGVQHVLSTKHTLFGKQFSNIHWCLSKCTDEHCIIFQQSGSCAPTLCSLCKNRHRNIHVHLGNSSLPPVGCSILILVWTSSKFILKPVCKPKEKVGQQMSQHAWWILMSFDAHSAVSGGSQQLQ